MPKRPNPVSGSAWRFVSPSVARAPCAGPRVLPFPARRSSAALCCPVLLGPPPHRPGAAGRLSVRVTGLATASASDVGPRGGGFGDTQACARTLAAILCGEVFQRVWIEDSGLSTRSQVSLLRPSADLLPRRVHPGSMRRVSRKGPGY